MENMDKGLTVPKWVLIVWPKIPQMPQNLSAQFVCPSPIILDFNEKRLHWASVVRGARHSYLAIIPHRAARLNYVFFFPHTGHFIFIVKSVPVKILSNIE